MIYDNDDTIEASITKTKYGQKIGLRLEEKEIPIPTRKGVGNKKHYRYVITKVGGLTKKKSIPVQIGDELLELNGMPVTNTELFPKGLKDIRRLMKEAWSVKVKIGRNYNSCNDGGETSATDTERSYLDADETDSGHSRYDIGEVHASVIVDQKPNSESVLMKRRGRRKKKETLGTLIRDTRSYTPPGRRNGTRRGKRPPKVTVNMAGSSHERRINNRNVVYGFADTSESSFNLE